MILCLTRNNQGRARLIDQNGIHLVNNGIHKCALASILDTVLHVVAQIVKAKFIVRAVRDVCTIRRNFFFVSLLGNHDTDGQTQKAIQTAHPLSVAPSQVIVDGYDVHAASAQGVQVDRQSRHQRLTFTRTHLCDLARMQHHAANQLHIEVPHTKNTYACFSDNGKSFYQ